MRYVRVRQMSMNPRKGTVTEFAPRGDLDLIISRQMSMNPRKGTVTLVFFVLQTPFSGKSDEHESSEGDCDAAGIECGECCPGNRQMSMNPRKGTVTENRGSLRGVPFSGQMSMNPRKGTVTV